MCLAVIALDRHPRYRIVIAANRDEFHARPAVPARWWEEHDPGGLLAGRDLEAGGTWLGVSTRGRWAFVTNVREPGRHDPHAATRGSLVPALLRDRRGLRQAMLAIAARGDTFNGFNLVSGDVAQAVFVSNRGADIVPLEPGIHGISNAQLDTPWPKVERAKAGVAAWLGSKDDSLAGLLQVLADRAPAPDAALPATGIPLARERLLSSAFIVSPDYGTRCSTVLAVTRGGEAEFIERSFDANGQMAGEVEYRFRLTGESAPESGVA